MPAKTKPTKFELQADPRGGWIGKNLGTGRTVARGDTKAPVLARMIAAAKAQPAATLKIKKQNGRIQEERTYPRNADPRRTKG